MSEIIQIIDGFVDLCHESQTDRETTQLKKLIKSFNYGTHMSRHGGLVVLKKKYKLFTFKICEIRPWMPAKSTATGFISEIWVCRNAMQDWIIIKQALLNYLISIRAQPIHIIPCEQKTIWW